MAALTEAEARDRAALIDVESYDVALDLTADPVRSRTEIRFGCREPGAGTFAELATAAVLGAVLNGQAVGPVRDGRLELPGLAARNVLVVDAEAAYSQARWGLTRFTYTADGATYLLFMGYPTEASSMFCCFDQPDLTAVTTLSLVLPGGWDCVTNGPVQERPAPGQAGMWRFGPVRGTRTYDLTIAAGPYAEVWRGSAGAQAVPMTLRRRPSLADAEGVASIAQFGQIARQALEYYERILAVPCPFPKYDIAFVPGLSVMAVSIPGLMLVNESPLARMSDPDDDANGFWGPGQEALLQDYRDRYFRAALPALEGREIEVMRNLARALYPATLAGAETLAAAGAAVEHGELSHGMRLIVLERDAIMRSVLAARSAKPRW